MRLAIRGQITRMRSMLPFVVLGVVVAPTAAAQSPVSLVFDPAAAQANDRVTVRAVGVQSGRPTRIYLVPTSATRSIRFPADPRLHFVGVLVPADGRGALTFNVPPLASGPYTAWCRGCSRSRHGSRALLRVTMPPATKRCPVTIPNGKTPPGAEPSPRFHWNGLLGTSLPVDGVFVGHRREPDGSIFDKLGWVPTGIGGVLTVRGRRLDAPSRPLRVLAVRWGYSSTGRGGWASAVVFPSEGCWKLTGRVKDVSLSYVVKVVAP
jgi:hypothetical protein